MHALMQRFIFACWRVRKNMLLQAPPEHAKTSQIIPTLIFILARDLKLKTGIVSNDADLSEEHLMKVRKLLTSPTCAGAFPQIEPDYNRSAADKGEWSKSKLYLVGQEMPAFECYTLKGAGEGHRLDMIWMDDCVTRQCLYHEAERRETASAIFDTFSNRLTDNGIALVTNNCWHREDAIHQMQDSPTYATLWIGYTDVDTMYFRISHPPEGWDGPLEGNLPLWEDQWPRARLIEKRDSPGTAWKRLFQGKAITPEDCRFPSRESWARWKWSDLPKSGKIVGFLDPAGGKNAKKGDFAALVTLLRHPDLTHDVIDVWCDRRPPEDQVAACFTTHEKWARLGYHGYHRLMVETFGGDLWMRPNFESHQQALRKSGSPYWKLPWDTTSPDEPKESRIERIGPPLVNGWLRFPEDLEDRLKDDRTGPHWRRLVEQLEEWPFNDHDDAPDALTGALDVSTGESPAVEEDTFDGVGVF